MKIIRGDELLETGSVEFDSLAAAYQELWLDIGSGDGSYVYLQARTNPSVLCVGFDPAWKNMSAISNRALRRKTAAPNALFVQGSIESPPAELSGRADVISINYPWSGLLRALVAPDPQVLGNIRALARSGATITVFLNLHVFQEEGLKDSLSLPALDKDYVTGKLAQQYQAQMLLIEAFELCQNELPVKTTWGSRLSLNSRRSSACLKLRAV